MKGARNIYACNKCGKTIVTEDLDEGVTPFMILCRATKDCNGFMLSKMYPKGINKDPDYVWRKPTKQEYKKASAARKNHYDRGGLDIFD